MNYGKLDKKILKGAGLGADCAFSSGLASGQALASGADAMAAARAYTAAVNHLAACIANNGAYEFPKHAHANLTLAVSGRLREIKVRGMLDAAMENAENTGIPIFSCNVQSLPYVTGAVASCAVCAADEIFEKGAEKRALPDEDIVMTKWLGLEGTAVMASESFDALCGRYPKDLVETAADFYRYLSIVPEAATAVKSGASYLHVLREGGIFGGLWKLAADNGVGLVADLKRIPVKQETIEVCEFFDINPYGLISGGSLLMTAANGGGLVSALEKEGIPAAVIGRTTQGNERVIRHGEDTRYLEPSNEDSIYKFLGGRSL